jgi:hypothetical protein
MLPTLIMLWLLQCNSIHQLLYPYLNIDILTPPHTNLCLCNLILLIKLYSFKSYNMIRVIITFIISGQPHNIFHPTSRSFLVMTPISKTARVWASAHKMLRHSQLAWSHTRGQRGQCIWARHDCLMSDVWVGDKKFSIKLFVFITCPKLICN